MKKRRGFTLIELLVVLAIIAVLSAVLLPVLGGKSKSKGSQAACLNNLRQFGIGLRLYVDDNDDLLPREKAFADVSSWNIAAHHTWAVTAAATNADVWYNALPTKIAQTPLATYASSSASRMDFYESSSGFHCPSAQFPETNDSYPMFSLAINAKLMRGSTLKQRFSAIAEPQRTVLFMEAGVPGEKKLCSGQARFNGQPFAFVSRFVPRHGRKGNLAIADGSVTGMRGEDVVDADPTSSNYGGAFYPQLNVVWTADPARNPN